MNQNKLKTWLNENNIKIDNFDSLEFKQAFKLIEQVQWNQKEISKVCKDIKNFSVRIKLLNNFRKTFFEELTQC